LSDLFGHTIEGRALPRAVSSPAFRIVMRAHGHDYYITTYHGSANKAARYAARLEARAGGRHPYVARPVVQ
jgi:hypothetical protein